MSQNQKMSLPSWHIVNEECLEDGWRKEDIINLKELIAFVNTFKKQGASKAQLVGWMTGKPKGMTKRVAIDQLLDVALSHFLLIQVDETYVGHEHSRLTPVHNEYDDQNQSNLII